MYKNLRKCIKVCKQRIKICRNVQKFVKILPNMWKH